MMKKMNSILIATLFPIAVIAGGGHGDSHGMRGMKAESHGHAEDAHKSGVGQAGMESEVSKTIAVGLLDTMRFEFSPALVLKSGDVVKFVVTNKGSIKHEFSIGSESEQIKHRKMMRSMPTMTHQDANTVTVEPGQSMSLLWKFDGDEAPVFACNIPGHAEAGMVKRIQLM